ncbi:Spy/CpxP family protein refolding chaperone [Acidobacteriota bacterium]
MKKTLKIASIISVILIFTVTLVAQQQGHMRGRQQFNRQQFAKQHQSIGILRVLKVHQEELKVTDEQLNQIKDMMESHQKEMIKAKSEGQLQALELRKFLQDRDNRDYGKIKEALAKASAFRNNQVIDRMQFQEKLFNVLTPEQKDAFKALQKKSPGRGQKMKQGRRGNSRRGFSRGMNRGFNRSGTRGLRSRRPPVKKDVNIK